MKKQVEQLEMTFEYKHEALISISKEQQKIISRLLAEMISEYWIKYYTKNTKKEKADA